MQPASRDNSGQHTNYSNMTTIYYKKSNGEHHNKTTGIQTSPRDPEPTGTTTTTQISHKMASQAGRPQTTPPPSPKKSTSTGGTQTSHSSQSQFQRSNSKNLGNSRLNNKSSQSFRNTNNYFDYRESQRQPYTRFDER